MPFELLLNPDDVRVQAGQTAEIAVMIRNAGEAEEEYLFDVLGLDASVFQLPERALRLPPGGAGTVPVVLSPPAGGNIRTASYTFRVRVATPSREQQIGTVRLTIEPAMALKLELSSTGANRFDLQLHNEADREMEVQLKAEERESAGPAFDYDFASPMVRLGPRESARVPLRLRARQRPLFGGGQTRSFVVHATPEIRNARSETVEGRGRSLPLVPWWLLIVLLLLAILSSTLAWLGQSRQSTRIGAARAGARTALVGTAPSELAAGRGGGAGGTAVAGRGLG